MFNKLITFIMFMFLFISGVSHSVFGKQCPILKINNIIISPSTPTTLDSIQITIQVINNGHLPGSGTLYLKVGDKTDPFVYTISEIYSLKSRNITRTINLTEGKNYQVTAVIHSAETDRCPEMSDKMSRNLKVIKAAGKGIVSWDQLITIWNLFGENMHVRFHNHDGHRYKNSSELVLLGKSGNIDFPVIEFEKNESAYRYLCNDLNSQDTGITLTKEGCEIHQIRMDIPFENKNTDS